MNFDYHRLISDLRHGRYEVIGQGSGRRVYDLQNGTVAKFARNSRGLAQNRAEYRIWSESTTSLLCKIVGVSPDYRILLMEKAEKVRHFSDILDYFHIHPREELLRMPELNDFYHQFNLLPADFLRSANWGFLRGRPVIVDYGFTRHVRNAYYT